MSGGDLEHARFQVALAIQWLLQYNDAAEGPAQLARTCHCMAPLLCRTSRMLCWRSRGSGWAQVQNWNETLSGGARALY